MAERTARRRPLLRTADSTVSEQLLRDASAFAEIVEAHSADLQRIALRLSGDPEIAKDLVQEALARGWERFAQFQKGTHAGAWLTVILTRIFLDHLKHEKVERKAEPELTTPEAVEWVPAVFSVTDADLYTAIQLLEPPLRDAVELCYLQQMRRREAAMVLNVPEGTIATRLMRAREQLLVLLTHSTPASRMP